jgi:hypothetical protein
MWRDFKVTSRQKIGFILRGPSMSDFGYLISEMWRDTNLGARFFHLRIYEFNEFTNSNDYLLIRKFV